MTVQTESRAKRGFSRSKGLSCVCRVFTCIGYVSYDIFSVSISVPKIYVGWTKSRSGVIADVLWFNAHLGIGTYIYRQRFMRRASIPNRILFTTLCTVMFNFGSALIWGTVRSLLPTKAEKAKIAFGLMSGMVFLWTGRRFILFLNSICQ